MTTDSIRQLRQWAERLAADQRHLLERFSAEIEFAEGLARLHPRKAKTWRRLIDQATDAVAKAAGSGRADRLRRAVRDAETLLAPVGKAAKAYTVHCVGHGHIDMNWMWSWPETVAVTNDTFTTVLRLMDEFDDFCYTQSQASVYAICADYSPDLLERIKVRVAEGRWEVAAAHWVEGDKNLAAGEALARHLLYTRRFVADLFGLTPAQQPLDWEPDTFGHAATIPGIDARGGVKWYYMCRGGHWDKPPVFWWRGPDGSRLLVYFDRDGYNGAVDPRAATGLLAFCETTGLKDGMCVYGVGDHGGGPTRRDILRAHAMDAWPVFPRFRLATARSYYQILQRHGGRWDEIDRELNFEFTGCYTSQSRIKRNNRYGENHMLEAEVAATLALRAVGRDYPGDVLRKNWIDVLFSQFHDILPGSGFPETRQYNQGQFQRIAAAASMIKTHSLRAVAGAVDTSGGQAGGGEPDAESIALGAGAGRGAMVGGLSAAAHVVDGPRPFVVFNPTASPRREVVQATIWDVAGGDLDAKTFVVRAADGAVLPAQKVGSGNYWGHRFVELLFPAEAGRLGYAAYMIDVGTADAGDPPVTCQADPPRHVGYGDSVPVLANEFLAVRFDPSTGGVVQLLDKASGRDLAGRADPAGVLEYVLERPAGMSAWVIAPAAERKSPLTVHALRHVQHGPYAASVEAKLKVHDSAITVTYTLKAGQPWLEVHVAARWVERGGPDVGTPGLCMRFPLALAGAVGRYEVPFGSVARDLNRGEEVPALRWADVTGRVGSATGGCALLNDSKYGHSLDGSTLRLTLIRSSYEPDPLPEIGDHSIRMALAPHGRSLPPADLIRMAAAFNHPLQVVATDIHAGDLPPAGAAVADVRPGHVVLSSVKQAEDDDALVFRLYETSGKPAAARVSLDRRLMGVVRDAVEVDLLERPVACSTAKATQAGFAVAVPAGGIASVLVRFED